MSTHKLSKTTLAWRLVLMFIVIFVVVFGVLIILQSLGLGSYAPFVAGAVAGAASVAVNLALNRRDRTGESN
jgi:lipopolysaccharide export LptBFGC system permease protein LptF